MILAGDIGGTKTNLAYVRAHASRLEIVQVWSYASREHNSLRQILEELRREHPEEITAAAFGIAGPVVNGRCEATNLPWVVDAREIATALALARCHLLNDLEATAYGVLNLGAEETVVLNPGVPVQHAAIAVIAAGTGLGEGGLVWNGSAYKALPSEGGHSDFAPRNELEIDLLRFMLHRYERVSVERLVSGPGLFNIYQFFRSRATYPEPAWLRRKLDTADPPAVVSQAAMEQKDECCAQALEMFVSLYGAEAGNLALKLLATGGIYIGGGIAPKIVSWMERGSFLKSLTHKGRFSALIAGIPVRVVMNDRAALLGAAHIALMQS